MLREEDCKPGVEVICIDNGFRNIRSLFRQNAWHVRLLKVGQVYTCDGLAPHKENAYPPGLPCIYLGEIDARYKSGNRVVFGVDRFKLKPPKKDVLSSLRNLDVDLPKELIEEWKEFEKHLPEHEKERIPERVDRLMNLWKKTFRFKDLISVDLEFSRRGK